MPRHNTLTSADADRLVELFKVVPTETQIKRDWKSKEGKSFIDAVRKIQLEKNVRLSEMAEVLNVSIPALSNAVGYWKRGNSRYNSVRSKDAVAQKRAEARKAEAEL